MHGFDRNNLHVRFMEPQIQFAASRFTEPHFDDHCRLKHSRGRDKTYRITGNTLFECWCFRFAKRNGHNGGRIDHHQLGNPFSS